MEGLVGTPFEPEDQDELNEKKKDGYVPHWKQEVTDENGKRRFHGAFTGGFSAGYWNTVGSKEGWAPKTFKSSRSERAQTTQKPEDFMDEEDKELLGIEGKDVAPTDDFNTLGSTSVEMEKKKAAQMRMTKDGVIPNFLPDEIAGVSVEPIGKRLLRTMGWRDGKGIGAVRKKRKREEGASKSAKVYGVMLPPELQVQRDLQKQMEDDEEEEEEEVPFGDAQVAVKEKNNLFGVGYDPHRDAPEFRARTADTGDKKGPVLRKFGDRNAGGGFGVGAYEVEGDDVYHRDDMSNYDIALTSTRPSGSSSLSMGMYSQEQRLCSDGSKPLRGFRVGSTAKAEPKWFAPPTVPPDYDVFYVPESTAVRGETSGTLAPMDAHSRAGILEDRKVPSVPSSVFDLMSQEDRHRMTAIANAAQGKEMPNPQQQLPGPKAPPERPMLPARNQQTPGLEWEKARDAIGSSLMDRFHSGGMASDEKNLPQKKAEEDSSKAAEMKMYGKLTRTEETWRPNRLLCKRWNVRDPYAGMAVESVASSKLDEMVDTFQATAQVKNSDGNNGERMALEFSSKGGDGGAAVPSDTNKEAVMELLKDSDDEGPGESDLPADRPPIDIFKAVFSDSSESEEDEEEEEEEEEEEQPPQPEENEVSDAKNDSSAAEKGPAADPNVRGPSVTQDEAGPAASAASNQVVKEEKDALEEEEPVVLTAEEALKATHRMLREMKGKAPKGSSMIERMQHATKKDSSKVTRLRTLMTESNLERSDSKKRTLDDGGKEHSEKKHKKDKEKDKKKKHKHHKSKKSKKKHKKKKKSRYSSDSSSSGSP